MPLGYLQDIIIKVKHSIFNIKFIAKNPHQMKTILIILFAFASSFQTLNAQSFTLNELFKLHDSNDDFFDTYVIKKGYTYYTSHQLNDSIQEIVYSISTKRPIDNSIRILYAFEGINKIRYITWEFRSDSDYIVLKKELLDNNLALVKDNYKTNGEHSLCYQNSKYFISLETSKPLL